MSCITATARGALATCLRVPLPKCSSRFLPFLASALGLISSLLVLFPSLVLHSQLGGAQDKLFDGIFHHAVHGEMDSCLGQIHLLRATFFRHGSPAILRLLLGSPSTTLLCLAMGQQCGTLQDPGLLQSLFPGLLCEYTLSPGLLDRFKSGRGQGCGVSRGPRQERVAGLGKSVMVRLLAVRQAPRQFQISRPDDVGDDHSDIVTSVFLVGRVHQQLGCSLRSLRVGEF
mmetsp:Transcript_3195/g.9258  ORF Transcript_3195/g.9258 Transcript_3195/m.9258 type:complete len:229 (-) Transcript_3195:756-1442(-)